MGVRTDHMLGWSDRSRRAMADVTLDEVWRLFKATDENIARLSEEARQARAETAASQRKTEEALRDLARKMGRLGNQLGEFVEDMVVPAAERLFLDRGIPVHVTSRNVVGRYDGRATEFDIIVEDTDEVLVIEVKSRPKVEHVDDHVARLVDFREYLPRYRNYRVLGAIAGMYFDEGVARYAYRQGLFVLSQSGETVVIRNDEKFRPKVW